MTTPKLKTLLQVTLFVIASFMPLAFASANADLAVEYFQHGEQEFTARNFDVAMEWYKKAIAELAQDGPVVLGTATVVVADGNGRFANRVTKDEIQRAEYFPNKRIDEINALRLAQQRRVAPPKLRVQWLTFSEPTHDNVLDGGERGTVTVSVENSGSSPAIDVYLEVTANELQGLLFPRRIDIGNITPNESTLANIPIEAARAIGNGEREMFIAAKERDGLESNHLKIPLTTRPHEPASVEISSAQMVDLTGDGFIEPLETVSVTALVTNIGKGVSNSLIARLDLGKGVVAGPDHREPFVVGELYPGQARKVEFSFLADSHFDDEQKLPIVLRVVDDNDARQAEKDLDVYLHRSADKRVSSARRRPILTIDEQDVVDVDVAVPRSKTRRPDAVAVVIGNRNYLKPGLPSVKYAHNDARLVKQYLVSALGYDEANIIYLEDATTANFAELFGTHDIYKGRLNSYIKPGQSDVFIYYSGHGAPDLTNNGAFFVPVDADPNYIALSGYALDVFYKNLAQLPALSLTVVLDTCFSGNSDGGFLLANISPANIRVKSESPGLANANVFTSTRPQQVSAWYHEKHHGLFTYYFLKGLSGAADTDKNKIVTSTELGDYVAAEVPHQARRKYGLEQNPVLIEKQPMAMIRLGE